NNDRLFAQYTFNDGKLNGATTSNSNGTSSFPSNQSSQPERHQSLVLSWSRTFSPTLVNDLRLGVNRYLQGRVIGPKGDMDSANFNLPGATVPGLVIAGGGNVKKLGNTQPQMSDKATWVKGKSTLSFGGNYSYLITGQAQQSFIGMGFLSLADFAADNPS